MSGFQELKEGKSNAQVAKTESGTSQKAIKIITKKLEDFPEKVRSPWAKLTKEERLLAKARRNRLQRERRIAGRLTFSEIKELFDYDEAGLLRWRVSPRFGIAIGSIAGNLNKLSGYYDVMIRYKTYKLHRVIYMWHHGYMPENPVDHRDRNPLNNKIDNLREVSKQCNNRNCNVRADSKTGITGVCFSNRASKWEANIRIRSRSYALIQTKDFIEAVAHRLAAEQCCDWSKCSSDSTAYQFMQNYLKENQCI